MQSMLLLRIFNCQKFPLLLNFNFRRQFGLFQCLVKLPAIENGKTKNLQHHFLQKQMASTFTETESLPLPYKYGKRTRFLNIECFDGKNNKKYIDLSNQADFNKFIFPYIPLPEDAHSLVKAMDTIMSKFPDEEKPPIFYEFIKSSRPNYEYKLEIHRSKNGHLEFSMEKVKKTKNASSHQDLIFFPVSLLPELRNRMGRILAKFDSTKQCGPCPSPLPKWITMEEEKAADEQSKYRDYRCESLKYSMDRDKPADRRISIAFRRGPSGKKSIQILQRHDKVIVRGNTNAAKNGEEDYLYISFPKIPVPEDGYNLLSGMIDLSNDFKKKDKLRNQRNNHHSSLICRQIIKGKFYDYKLEMHSYNDQQELGFRMQSITTDNSAPWHKPRELFVPIHVFEWLQAQMAYSLAAHLDTEEYEDKEQIAEDESIPSSNN